MASAAGARFPAPPRHAGGARDASHVARLPKQTALRSPSNPQRAHRYVHTKTFTRNSERERKGEDGGALEAAIPYQSSRPLRHGSSSAPFYSLLPLRQTYFFSSFADTEYLLPENVPLLVSASPTGRGNLHLPRPGNCEQNVRRAPPHGI